MSTPELLSFAHTREVKSVNTRAENDSQCNKPRRKKNWKFYFRGTQREYSSKPLKHSIVKRILVFKR